jgi:urea carboxylase-associated protein 2
MTSDPPLTDGTGTTSGARAHARAMAGTLVDAMPTIPAPDGLLWDEVVAGGGYTALRARRGTRISLTDIDGGACAGLLLHRADQPSERLNVADTVKVQWQAYLGAGSMLLSDMGRVLATIVEDTSSHHDTFCGTTNARTNAARYGDGAPDGSHPNGRDHFGVALAKLGLARRDIAPNLNLFASVRVEPDGRLAFDPAGTAGAQVVLRCELPLLVSIVNVPHPLDARPAYTVTPLHVTAWEGPPTEEGDPLRTATPEAHRAFLATEREVLL